MCKENFKVWFVFKNTIFLNYITNNSNNLMQAGNDTFIEKSWPYLQLPIID